LPEGQWLGAEGLALNAEAATCGSAATAKAFARGQWLGAEGLALNAEAATGGFEATLLGSLLCGAVALVWWIDAGPTSRAYAWQAAEPASVKLPTAGAKLQS